MIGNPDSYYGATASEYDAKRDRSALRRKERDAVRYLLPARTVLDAPVGTGAFSDIYRQYGGTGIDSSDEMLDICKNKHPWMRTHRVDLKDRLPYRDRQWGAVLCVRFAWWLKDGELQSVMAELRRVSRCVVYSVRIGQYGTGPTRKSLAHTQAMVDEANGGWRVTGKVSMTPAYHMLRIEP